ncbi:MAG: molybdenum cofactor guanylyltransferase [Gemmatimonadetes bacterium]|nr:molybdenum cofactor guanylyltransferase [Gemmatimonadota bacterium]
MSVSGRSLVILAGGQSSRLGRQKPLVEIEDRPIVLRILDATTEIDEVVIAVRETWRFLLALEADGWERASDESGAPATESALLTRSGRSVRLVADPEPDLGPLGGFVSGMSHVTGHLVLVLAGDLPFVTSAFAEEILDILSGDLELDAVVPFVSGRAQPLCAAYRPEVRDQAARLLETALVTNESASMTQLIESLSLRYIGADALTGVENLATLTRGIDTPEDLQWARREAELRAP